jgi:hypothetical protein
MRAIPFVHVCRVDLHVFATFFASFFVLPKATLARARTNGRVDFAWYGITGVLMADPGSEKSRRLFPVFFQEQFFDAVGVEHVVHGKVAKHDEHGIAIVLAVFGGPAPILRR